jgi:uncharacterized membrane protein (UPF0127 family)
MLNGESIVFNETKKMEIGSAKFADSFFSRLMGLMFKKKIYQGLILKIPNGRGRRGSSIHMFFMRIPLDVIFLDENRKVVDVVSLKPWQTYVPKHPARYVIEFEEGKHPMPSIGDKLDFTCRNV